MPDAGTRVGGRYRLDRQLATGGMGTVWHARDEVLRRAVAVKALHVQRGLSDSEREMVVQRAMREARITARLHHAHAVQVFDVVDQPDGPCLIMEYVESRSLQQIVSSDGPLPPAEAARIGTQVAAALAAAHRAGIVHRDVKPGNVLITADGTAKITDFGISHAFDDVTLTSTGMLTGTPAFLAPEVARGADSTFASDVYSLGSTLFYAVEGESPFGTDSNPMATLHRVASGHAQPPRRSAALAPMLRAMMAVDPADRPRMVEIAGRLPDVHPISRDTHSQPTAASTTQVLQRTHNGSASEPPSAAPPSSGTLAFSAPPPPPPPRLAADDEHPRRRGWIPIAAVALVVALAVVLGAVLLHDSGGNSTAGGGGASTQRSAHTSPAPRSTDAATTPSNGPHKTSHAARSPKHPKKPQGRTGDQVLANAVVAYFRLMPGSLDAGWASLTKRFQHGRAHGRSSYDSYWRSIERVDVRNVRGDAPHTASARLTYHYKNGQVVTQQTTFRFVRQDGRLKIDSES